LHAQKLILDVSNEGASRSAWIALRVLSDTKEASDFTFFGQATMEKKIGG